VLNSEELKDLVESSSSRISKEIERNNRLGCLTDYLYKIGCADLLKKHQSYVRGAKILVFGASEISEDIMRKIAKENGIDPKTLEFETDYRKNKHYDFSLLKNNTNYSDTIFGPIAHKGVNIGNNSSALAMIENDPAAYPNLIRTSVNNDLKITRNSFREAIVKTQAYKDFIGY